MLNKAKNKSVVVFIIGVGAIGAPYEEIRENGRVKAGRNFKCPKSWGLARQGNYPGSTDTY